MKIGLPGLHKISTNGINLNLDKQQKTLSFSNGISGYQKLDYIDKDNLNAEHFFINDEIVYVNALSSINTLNYIDTAVLLIKYDKLILNNTVYIRSHLNRFCWINNQNQCIYQSPEVEILNVGDSLYITQSLAVAAGTITDITYNIQRKYIFKQSQSGVLILSNGTTYTRNRVLDNHNVFAWSYENITTIYTNKYNMSNIYFDSNLVTPIDVEVTDFKNAKWIADNSNLNYEDNKYKSIEFILEDSISQTITCEQQSVYTPFPSLFKTLYTDKFQIEIDINVYTQVEQSNQLVNLKAVNEISKEYLKTVYSKEEINFKLSQLYNLLNNVEESNSIFFTYDDAAYQEDMYYETTDSLSGTLKYD